MADLSNHAETLLLRWMFTADSVTRPTAWHVGLGTAGTDASVTEFSGNGYARQAATFTVSGGVATVVSPPIVGPASGAGFQDADVVGVWDASTSGNLLAWRAVTQVDVNAGQSFNFNAGRPRLTLAGLSPWAINLLMQWMFTTATVTRPTVWRAALGTGVSGGVLTGELTAAGYSRPSVTMSVTDDVASNAGAAVFNPSANWGSVTHGGLFDAATAGNCYGAVALTNARTIDSGVPASFGAGALRFRLA